MESNSYSRQVKITRLLPFMNRKFFELFFEKNKIRVSDIKIENENNLPSKISQLFRRLCNFIFRK